MSRTLHETDKRVLLKLNQNWMFLEQNRACLIIGAKSKNLDDNLMIIGCQMVLKIFVIKLNH